MQTIDQPKAINNMATGIQSKQYNQQYGQSNQNNAINNLIKEI